MSGLVASFIVPSMDIVVEAHVVRTVDIRAAVMKDFVFMITVMF